MIKRSLAALARRFGYDISRRLGHFGGLGFLDVKPGDFVIDVGGHVGGTALELRNRFPAATIHVFEPFPDYVPALSAIARRDGNMVVHRLACSDREGVANLVTTAHNLSLVSVHRDSRSAGEPPRTIEIRADRLDAIAGRLGISRIRLLKIDAEGHDLAVLRGAGDLISRHRIDVVVVEVMFVEIFAGQPLFSDIVGFMGGHGYRLFDLRQIKKRNTGQYRFGNAVFTAPHLISTLDPDGPDR